MACQSLFEIVRKRDGLSQTQGDGRHHGVGAQNVHKPPGVARMAAKLSLPTDRGLARATLDALAQTVRQSGDASSKAFAGGFSHDGVEL